MLSNELKIKNKKAQVSDVLTWVVATLIIVFLIVGSIYISSLMGKSKSVEKSKIISAEDSVNWIETKTNFSLEINNANKDKIEMWIGESGVNNEKWIFY